MHVKDGTKMINFSCTLFRLARLVINYKALLLIAHTRIIMITHDYILLYYYYLLLIINNNKLMV